MELKTMGTRSISTGRAAGLKPAQEAAPEVCQSATCCEGHLDARWLRVNHNAATLSDEIREYGRMKRQPVVQPVREVSD